MRGSLFLLAAVMLPSAVLAQAAPAPSSKPQLAAVKPAEFGQPFPPGKFANLNPAAGQPANVDLGAIIGRKPIVLVYWMAGNPRSEKVLQETQQLVDSLGAVKDKIAFFAVSAPPLGSTDTSQIKTRSQAIDLRAPSLYDEGFRILQELDVRTVPTVTIIDGKGILRLSNAGSIKQTLEYKMDVAAAIKRVATTGQLGTYGPLPTYYPVLELVGQKYVDFTGPEISGGTSKSYSSMFAPGKVNVLIFWSVDCPHCKAAMPKLNDWLKTHTDGINVVSLARVMDDSTKTRTAEYCRVSGLVFPTLVDKDMQIASLYQVVSTPTLVVIRPDGVIDSVLLSGESDLGQALEQKKQQLLKGPGGKG